MANERTKCPLTNDQIKHMVNRFLAWKLPEDFTPDAGISFKPILRDGEPWPEAWPVGTNLLMASQAEAMIRYMVDGIQHGGVCLWCGFSTTKGSLDELADAIYAHLGECHASPVPALQSAIRASEARELVLRDALMDYGRHIQSIPELGIVGCDFDPEIGATCTCGFRQALSNTSATAQEIVQRIEREALEKLGSGVQAIALERKRQVVRKEWTPEHDDEHDKGELAEAAAAYTIASADPEGPSPINPPTFWPWGREWWKPSTRRRNLEKAGALILAEIERLDRANPEPPTCGHPVEVEG